MTDYFSTFTSNLSAPAEHAETVDISATDHTFSRATRGLIVNVAGNVKADFVGGSTGITLTLLAGVIYPLRLTKIYKTGTTATGITGLS